MRYCNILLKRGGISKEIPIKTVKVKGKTMKVKGKTIKVKGKTMKVEGICCIIVRAYVAKRHKGMLKRLASTPRGDR